MCLDQPDYVRLSAVSHLRRWQDPASIKSVFEIEGASPPIYTLREEVSLSVPKMDFWPSLVVGVGWCLHRPTWNRRWPNSPAVFVWPCMGPHPACSSPSFQFSCMQYPLDNLYKPDSYSIACNCYRNCRVVGISACSNTQSLSCPPQSFVFPMYPQRDLVLLYARQQLLRMAILCLI